MKKFKIGEEEKLIDVAKFLISNSNKDKNIISMSGDLGAGKTALSKKIASVLKVTSEITSPTFTIIKEYTTQDKTFKHLYHFDIYRIKEVSELDNIGFFEYLYKDKSLCIIEWGDKIRDLLPDEKTIDVKIETEGNARNIEIRGI